MRRTIRDLEGEIIAIREIKDAQQRLLQTRAADHMASMEKLRTAEGALAAALRKLEIADKRVEKLIHLLCLALGSRTESGLSLRERLQEAIRGQ